MLNLVAVFSAPKSHVNMFTHLVTTCDLAHYEEGFKLLGFPKGRPSVDPIAAAARSCSLLQCEARLLTSSPVKTACNRNKLGYLVRQWK